MKIKSTFKCAALGLLALSCLNPQLSTARAQGTAFTYQGRLNDGANPAVGIYDLRFAIYDSLNAGTQQGSLLTNSATAVSNGLFTVALDFGNQFPGAGRWLEIGVRTNGGGSFITLTPRQALTPAPYAVFAGSSSNLIGNLSATQIIGTLSPANIGAGSITATMLAPGAVSSLGAPDGSPTNAVQVNTNGLVGIGTTNPVAGLQIMTGAPVTTATVLFEAQNGKNGYTNLAHAWQPAVAGSLLAVSGSSSGDSGVTLVNIANPAAPVLASQIRNGAGVFTNLGGAEGLAWSGSNLVVAAISSSAVRILSAANPANPVKLAELRNGIGGWNSISGANCVAVSGNILAIGALLDSSVTLADISNPAAPVRKSLMQDGVSGFTNLSGVSSVALWGNLLAIGATDDNAVTLVNVSNPANPIKLAELRNGAGGYTNLSGVQSVALGGNLLVIGADVSSAVTLVDVSNPANPVKLAELKDGVGGYALNTVFSVALSGNRLAIAAAGSSTVTLVDVSSPANPVLLVTARDGVNGIDFLGGAAGVAFAGTNLAVTGNYDNSVTLLGVGVQQAGLASAGWVGIGTTQPMAALDVVGNVLVENAALFNINATHVAMGNGANASGFYATALGSGTTASGNYSTALGFNTTASGLYSAALCLNTTASGTASIALGSGTTASGLYSTALGSGTTASGNASIAMGENTIASGDASIALGYFAQANNPGSFVWADNSSGTVFADTAADQFLIRATGGVGIGTAAPETPLHIAGYHGITLGTSATGGGSTALRIDLSAAQNGYAELQAISQAGSSYGNLILQANGGNVGIGTTIPAQKLTVNGNILASGTITGSSDRNVKEHFSPVSARDVLEKVSALPISEWNYKADNEALRHIGPMAQDFYAAFNVGMDDKHISMVDADGVALAAIQGLNDKLESGKQKAETQMEELKTENAELEARLEKLEHLVSERK